MSTNYYWKVPKQKFMLPTGEEIDYSHDYDDDPRVHIGKRSGAGLYCWKCRVTLCIGGESRIHYTSSDGDWYGRCPECDAPKPWPPEIKTSVASCCSFTWAQDPALLRMVIVHGRGDKKLIVDENGSEMTPLEFMTMLETDCPVRFTDSIGKRFL